MNARSFAWVVAIVGCLAILSKTLGATPVRLNSPLVAGGDVVFTSLQFSPAGSHVLYLADQNVDGVLEAFIVPTTGGTARRVNDPLTSDRDVSAAQFSPDGQRIVYHANQDNVQLVELYSTPSEGGTPVKLNGPLPASGSVGDLQFSADSSQVVYSADQDAQGAVELFSVPSGGGESVKINGALVAGGDVFLVAVHSMLEPVVYVADQEVDQKLELYAAAPDGGGSWKLNGPLTLNGGVNSKSVRTTADGSRAVYVADANVDEVFELFSVPTAGGEPVPLSGPLVLGGDVLPNPVTISPIGDRVLYLADQDTDEVFEIYSLPIEGGESTKLNGPLVPGGDVRETSLQFSPDGGQVLYTADQEVNEKFEVFVVPSAGGESLKLNSALASGGDVSTALFNADGSRVVYRADQDADEDYELYSVASAGGDPVKLNYGLTSGGDVTSFEITPDGSYVIYRADQEVNEMFELFAVPIEGGEPVRLNAPLVNGGDVTDWLISPDSQRIIYRADQDVDEVFELYSVALYDGMPGDFNGDGVVDAADYTMWRDGLGSNYEAVAYGVWKSNFGRSSSDGTGNAATVPEPASGVLMLGAVASVLSHGRRRERFSNAIR